jgi:hypothetical protein
MLCWLPSLQRLYRSMRSCPVSRLGRGGSLFSCINNFDMPVVTEMRESHLRCELTA